MRTTKIFNSREFGKILRKNGYEIIRYSGDHAIFMKIGTQNHIAVPRRLNRMICERLIKENNIRLDV